MGFFEGLSRLAKGEPVFQPGDNNDRSAFDVGNAPQQGRDHSAGAAGQQQGAQQAAGQPQQKHTTGIIKGQASTFPVVVVKRTRTQMSGSNQTAYCSIVNRSNLAVEVEEIRLNGMSRKIGGYLRPGEEREWLCYSGPRRTSEAYKEASLDYKVEENGDYFQTIYDVEYQLESDKTFTIEELHWRQPVRDIYG